jgi:hypothetical protein
MHTTEAFGARSSVERAEAIQSLVRQAAEFSSQAWVHGTSDLVKYVPVPTIIV